MKAVHKKKLHLVSKSHAKGPSRRCNLCNESFHPHSHFERYCKVCREQNELLRFGDWLPEIDEAIAQKISA